MMEALMSTAELERRIASLETKYAQLRDLVLGKPTRDEWNKVVGMFADDTEISELHEETRRIREEDRAAAREKMGDRE